MSFGIFESAITSDAEVGIARQASIDKFAAAVYDVREKLGPFLFTAHSLEEFRDRVAMVKNDQSVYRVIEASGLHPSTGIVRRIVGKNGSLERDFVRKLSQSYAGPDHSFPDGTKKDLHDAKDVCNMPSVSDKHKSTCDKIEHMKKPGALRRRSHEEEDRHPHDVPGYNSPGAQLLRDKLRKHDHGQPVIEGIEASRRGADRGTNEVSIPFEHSTGQLDPKADFKGYLKRHDQGAPGKVSDNDFLDGPGVTRHEGDPNKVVGLPRRGPAGLKDSRRRMALNLYLDWCKINKVSALRPSTLERYGSRLSDVAFMHLAADVDDWEHSHNPRVPSTHPKRKHQDLEHVSRRRHAADGLDGDLDDLYSHDGDVGEYLREHGDEDAADHAHDGHDHALDDDGEFADIFSDMNQDMGQFIEDHEHDHDDDDEDDDGLGGDLDDMYDDDNQDIGHVLGLDDDDHDHAPDDGLGDDGALADVYGHGGDVGQFLREHGVDPEDEDTKVVIVKKDGTRRVIRTRPRQGARFRRAVTEPDEPEVPEWAQGATASNFDGTPYQMGSGLTGIMHLPNRKGSRITQRYLAWCRRVGSRPTRRGQLMFARRVFRTAAPDHLQKADDALTALLNQRAEEFQKTIEPLQQALMTVQQAEALEQAQSPLNVMPPAGSVNVLPGQDQGGGLPPPADPTGAAAAPPQAPPQQPMDPSMIPGGMPGDAAGPGGGQDPSMMMQGRRRRQAGGVAEMWHQFENDPSETLRGDDSDYERFRQKFPGVGERGLNKLKRQNGGVDFARVNGQHANRRAARPKG